MHRWDLRDLAAEPPWTEFGVVRCWCLLDFADSHRSEPLSSSGIPARQIYPADDDDENGELIIPN